jgi:hypothetical protein
MLSENERKTLELKWNQDAIDSIVKILKSVHAKIVDRLGPLKDEDKIWLIDELSKLGSLEIKLVERRVEYEAMKKGR